VGAGYGADRDSGRSIVDDGNTAPTIWSIRPTLAHVTCHDYAVVTWEPESARARFDLAAHAFTTVVAKIGNDQWDQRGLGEWSARDLVGRGSRAFTLIGSCLEASDGEPGAPDLPDVPAYYRARAAARLKRSATARRGGGAGAALGTDPSATVVTTVARVRELVRASTDQVTVMTPAGTIRFLDYLVTRTFEITVHTLYLARALGVPVPDVLAEPVRAGLRLATAPGNDRPAAAELFLLLAGHEDVRQAPGFAA
jgi:hypothetical protein